MSALGPLTMAVVTDDVLLAVLGSGVAATAVAVLSAVAGVAWPGGTETAVTMVRVSPTARVSMSHGNGLEQAPLFVPSCSSGANTPCTTMASATAGPRLV